MYNFNHLYYFYITAKAGRVASAASHLKISQPSLSSQLRVLEEALDLKLFKKKGRTNELTEAGSFIYGYCRQMFELSEQMREGASNRLSAVMRRMHIGVSDEIDRSFVVEIISQFLKNHGLAQRPSVVVTSGTHSKLMNMLRFRELDAVISELAPTDLDFHLLSRAEVPVALVCSAKWKTRTSTSKLRPAEAIRELVGREDAEWVMPPERFRLRSDTDSFFANNALKGRVVFESDVMESIIRSVIDEVGLAFLPVLYIVREMKEKSLQVLGPKGGYWKYRLWLTCHKQNRDELVMTSLARSFTSVCAP